MCQLKVVIWPCRKGRCGKISSNSVVEHPPKQAVCCTRELLCRSFPILHCSNMYRAQAYWLSLFLSVQACRVWSHHTVLEAAICFRAEVTVSGLPCRLPCQVPHRFERCLVVLVVVASLQPALLHQPHQLVLCGCAGCAGVV